MQQEIECGGVGVNLMGEVPCLVHSLWVKGDKRFCTAGYTQVSIGRWDWWLKNPAGMIKRSGEEKTLSEAMRHVKALFSVVMNE